MTNLHNRTICLVALLVLAACDQERPANEPDAASRSVAALTRGSATPIQMLAFDSTVASGLPHRGDIVAGRRWRDSLGEHVLLLTETGELPSSASVLPGEDPHRDAEIYAYNYLRRGDSYELLWQTTDFERDCQFDLYATFVPGSVTVTDVDADGIAEATFLYSLVCTSDVSPATRKLIMHEGRTKYAIRGSTDLSRLSPEYGPGVRNLDPSLAGAAPEVRAFAIQQWERFVHVDPLGFHAES